MNASEVHPVDAVLPPGQKFLIGLQHVLVTYAGAIIAVIGITLLRVGITWAGGGVGAKLFGALGNLSIASVVMEG
jgi:xanthine/uracil permease